MNNLIFYNIMGIVLLSFFSCKTTTVDNFGTEEHHLDKIIKAYENAYLEKEGYPIIDYVLDKTLMKLHVFDNLSFDKLKYFNKEDIEYIQEQIKNYREEQIDSTYIISKKIIPLNTVKNWYVLKQENFWTEFETYYGKSGYYEISSPLFSKDKKICMIAIQTNYFESISSGAIYILEKKNDEWVIKEILNSWLG